MFSMQISNIKIWENCKLMLNFALIYEKIPCKHFFCEDCTVNIGSVAGKLCPRYN